MYKFCVMKSCENKEAAYEVLRFLYSDDTIRTYLSEQGGIACKQGDFPHFFRIRRGEFLCCIQPHG